MSKYDRLAGLKEAAEEGFEHTNPARVNMSKEEEEESKKYFKEKLSQMTESNISKDLYPKSEKDIEKLGGEQADISQGPKAHEKLLIEKLKKTFQKEKKA